MPARGGQPLEGLVLTDLHLTLDDLPGLLGRVLVAEDALDAYLLVAGAVQAVQDVLEDDPVSILRATSVADAFVGPRLARGLRAAGRLASARLSAMRGGRAGRLALQRAADELHDVLDQLAEDALGATWRPGPVGRALQVLAAPAVAEGPAGGAPVHLASCFRSLDVHPRDLVALAGRVAARRVPSTGAYLVVGVRTSGAFLAPLLARALVAGSAVGGGPRVAAEWCTLRPRRLPSPQARRLLAASASRGAHLVVVDDPPETGAALAEAVQMAVALGAPRDAVSVAFPLTEGGRIPASLAGVDAAVLDWREWDVHGRLAADAVARLLREGAHDLGEVTGLTPMALPARTATRSHARAGFLATVTGPHGDTTVPILAEGAGLGYLGRHAVAIARALGGHVPDLLAFGDGIAVRRWLDEDTRVDIDTGTRVDAALEYVADRRAALPAVRDAAASLAGRQPVWEVASRILAAPYREPGLALRALALDRAMRGFLAPLRASVIDGDTGPGVWFEPEGALVKVSSDDRAFSHLDLASYDARYDAAGVVQGPIDPALAALACAQHERRTGEPVTPEHLLLYRLVHLWDRTRRARLRPDAAERAMACAWQEWGRARLLGAPLDTGTGPWCVLDVDGTLESSRMGVAALTPSAARGLRALRDHGCRPLLATGRSSAEVVDRCQRYGLLGGVAEYGAVVVTGSGELRELVDAEDRAALDVLRAQLGAVAGVVLADGHRCTVRAYRLDSHGRRRGLDPATIDGARHGSGGRLYAVQGVAQTDFVPFAVDKGRGVRALLALLGDPEGVVALGVGDSEPDLAMLRLATSAWVPRNAGNLGGRGVAVTRAAVQRGLAEAVDDLLGHDARPCPTCVAPPAGSAASTLLVRLLEGLEGGRRTALSALPGLLAQARRVARQRARVPRPLPADTSGTEAARPTRAAPPISERAPAAGSAGHDQGRRTHRGRPRARSSWHRGRGA